MTYTGPKFETRIILKESPNDPRLEKLKYWCKVFHEKELAPPYEGGSYGNLSFRHEKLKSTFIATNSSTCLKEACLSNDCFSTVVWIDFVDLIICAHSKGTPTSEAMVHGAVYMCRPDINAIFHGHSEIISRAIKTGKIAARETERYAPEGTVELVNTVLEVLDKKQFLQMKDHGFLSFGESMDEAGERALKILESAKKALRK